MASLIIQRRYPVKEQRLSVEEICEAEDLLRNLKCSFSEAAPHFRQWVEQRERSIDTVDFLQKKLEKIHRACNVAHGVGSAMEVAGGVAMIAGVILSACGHKSVGKFLTEKAASATTTTGIATTVSSSLAEFGLTYQVINQANSVLAKDEEYTRVLMEKLQFSRKIDEKLRRIFNCSTLSNIFVDVVRLCMEGFSLLRIGYEEYSNFLYELKRKTHKCSDISDYTETVIRNVYATMEKISHDPKVHKAVWNICCILQESPLIVEFVKLGLRTSIQVCDILKANCCSSLITLGDLNSVMATQCLLGTVQIAVSALAVINAVQKAKKNTSKHSEMLGEIKMALAVELGTVRKNYSKLFLKY